MNKQVKYARYVALHKYYVARECFKRGLYWRGVVHDLTKLRPDEWLPYANFFYSDEQTKEVKDAFFIAWLKHLNRNSHHWNHWVVQSDGGVTKVFEMPEKDRIEMLCDWLGVQAALGKNDLPRWYAERESTMLLGPKTKSWLKRELKQLATT